MIQDYGVTPDDMYNLVLDGKWTYDKLSEMARQAYRDVNNNNERDQDDVYGFYINPFSDPEHFAYTAGNKMSYRDEYGYPVLNVLTDKFADYMSMFYDLCFNNEGVYPIKEDNQAYPIQRFNDGYALFLTYRLLACLLCVT